MSWMEAPEGLVKLRVDLPNHPLVTGETLWGKQLRHGLFEIRNVPFHAYGLNFRDVVETTAQAAGEPPLVRRVQRRSGHRTLRVTFTEEALLEERVPSLMKLRPLGGTFEGASPAYFAIDVEPGGDYLAICHQLEELRDQGLLSFETGESGDEASFDSANLKGL
jgi:Domain of unknown function (DUF4265)